MNSEWPEVIVQSIARRKAVIVIGSGVSANASTSTGQYPPTWAAFLEGAYKKLDRRLLHIKNAIKRYSFLEACYYLKKEYGPGWPDILRASYSVPMYKPADIHQAIFDLDCRIIVSLNFDKIYESYALKASENTVVVKNYYDEDIRQVVAGSGRYILKPHGSIDTTSKMIFTLDDYAKARVQYDRFYELLRSLLHTHTIICIGCGLSDPDMQILFEDYRYKHDEFCHFMTLPQPISEEQKEMILQTRGLSVLSYSAKYRHKALTTGLLDLVSKVTSEREKIADYRSW